jgi:hypothetical protein
MEKNDSISQKKDSLDFLDQSILDLQQKQAFEKQLIVDQWQKTVKEIQPVNWLKNSATGPVLPRGLTEYMINGTIALSVAYLTKLIFVGFSRNPAKKLVGSALMVALTNILLKNPEAMKSFGISIYHFIKKLRALRSNHENEME